MIQLLRGTQSQLNSYSTIIPDGQPVFERDTGQLKIGTGSARYSNLPYVGSIFESSGGGGEVTIPDPIEGDGYVDFASGLRVSWYTYNTGGVSPTWRSWGSTGFYISTDIQLSGSELHSKGKMIAAWAQSISYDPNTIVQSSELLNSRTFQFYFLSRESDLAYACAYIVVLSI